MTEPINGRRVGQLAAHDPLHGFLDEIVHRSAVHEGSATTYRVFRLGGPHEVYCYEERASRVRIVCKFYGARFRADPRLGPAVAQREYDNLSTLRSYGLVGSPYHVVAPLALGPDIDGVIAIEYFAGEGLAAAMRRATHHGDNEYLFRRLDALAGFLAAQHNRTAEESPIDFDLECDYFDSVIDRLSQAGHLSVEDSSEFSRLRDRWRASPKMWCSQRVWLHGDATPGNFIFGPNQDVGAIDLERMRRGDRAFDVGRLIAELQHGFMVSTGRKSRAEPFIGRFFEEYCRHLPQPASALAAISNRTPFYMGLNLLRISRNDYVERPYRERLIRQARRLLLLD